MENTTNSNNNSTNIIKFDLKRIIGSYMPINLCNNCQEIPFEGGYICQNYIIPTYILCTLCYRRSGEINKCPSCIKQSEDCLVPVFNYYKKSIKKLKLKCKYYLKDCSKVS